MNNLELYDKFRKVPKEAQKQIAAGRLKGFTDINPMWRIKTLTEEFGRCGQGWKYEIVSQELKEGANGVIAAFVTINLFYKIGDKWSDAVQGIGGSMFVSKESAGLYVSDECFKMALTDAIGIACKALGMGADVYFEKDRTKYDNEPEQPKAQPEVKEPDFEAIEAELKKCKTVADVTQVWVRNAHLKTNEDFKILVNRYGDPLKQKEQKQNATK